MREVTKSKRKPFKRRRRGRWWTSITHVCHHWRSLALATPTLWNSIVVPLLHQPDLVDLFGPSKSRKLEQFQEWLRRSEEAPLTVYYPLFSCENLQFNYANSKAATRFIEWYGHRIEELEVHLTTIRMQKMDWSTLLKTLQSLAITYIRLRHMESNTFSSSFLHFIVSSNIRRLSLYGFSNMHSFWSIPALPTVLQHLQLESPRLESASLERCSLEQILTVLEGLPHLESLRMGYTLKYPPHSLSAKIVRPQKLRSLSIEDSAVQVADLLCHMEFLPASLIEVRLHCVERFRSMTEDWPYVSHNLSKIRESSHISTGNIAHHAVRSCMIHFNKFAHMIDSYFAICCFTELLPAEDLAPGNCGRTLLGDLDFQFTSSLHDHGALYLQPKFDLCQGLSLRHTEVLALYGGVHDIEETDTAAWVQFLRNEFRNVRVLRLGPSGTHRSLAFFPTTYLLDGVHDDNGQDIIFPELSDLYISESNENSDIYIRSTLFYNLRRALATRKRVGKGITNLYLAKSWEEDDESHIDRFYGVVDYVLLYEDNLDLSIFEE